MKTNTKPKAGLTHEGAVAATITPEEQLRRSVMACMLWESTFYEDGESVADRIGSLVAKVRPSFAANIALEARTKQNLRHASLWVVVSMIKAQYKSEKDRAIIGRLLPEVLLRADELPELLSLYWMDGKKPLTRQMKIGLANALKKFDEYQLAKYDREGAVRLRDVLFLCHAKAKDAEQEALFKRLANRELATPDTWEVALSAGADKRETFERLMAEDSLGALAFLRNLRGMKEAGVEKQTVASYGDRVNLKKVLPFRFIAAARAVPEWESLVETWMLRSLEGQNRLGGQTVVVVDNSGSMYGARVSARSDLNRSDAACALAILVRELCDDCVVIGFANEAEVIPDRRGFALADAIKSGPKGGTKTDKALELAEVVGYDRIIVVTDEQSHEKVRKPKGAGYFINVANYANGIGYRDWLHIDGWSESVLDYLVAWEAKD